MIYGNFCPHVNAEIVFLFQQDPVGIFGQPHTRIMYIDYVFSHKGGFVWDWNSGGKLNYSVWHQASNIWIYTRIDYHITEKLELLQRCMFSARRTLHKVSSQIPSSTKTDCVLVDGEIANHCNIRFSVSGVCTLHSCLALCFAIWIVSSSLAVNRNSCRRYCADNASSNITISVSSVLGIHCHLLCH